MSHPKRSARDPSSLSDIEHRLEDRLEHLLNAPDAIGGPDAHASKQKKSLVLKALAETLTELEKHETDHFDALFREEQQARMRYIQQFQSLSAKVQELTEINEVDQQFRRDYRTMIMQYNQDQEEETKAFNEDMTMLRDLETIVRQNLPAQLEALASLAQEIQAELRHKADMNATKARLLQINQRLVRLDEVIATKADTVDLEAQQVRLKGLIPDRDRLANAFDLIGPIIRQAGGAMGRGDAPAPAPAQQKAAVGKQTSETKPVSEPPKPKVLPSKESAPSKDPAPKPKPPAAAAPKTGDSAGETPGEGEQSSKAMPPSKPAAPPPAATKPAAAAPPAPAPAKPAPGKAATP